MARNELQGDVSRTVASPWSWRSVDRLIGYCGVPFFILGAVGLGIVFQHYAHRTSGWFYCPVLLGAFLAGMVDNPFVTGADQSRAARPLLPALIVYVIAAVALGLGLLAGRAMADTPQWAGYTLAVGMVLGLCMAVYWTLLGTYVMWRQRRDGV